MKCLYAKIQPTSLKIEGDMGFFKLTKMPKKGDRVVCGGFCIFQRTKCACLLNYYD